MSLLNLYKFNDNANDLVGSDNGTLAGAASPTYVPGKFGGADNHGLNFTGDNGTTNGNRSRVEFGGTDCQYAYTDSFTLNFWMKIDYAGNSNNAYFLWVGDLDSPTGNIQFETRESTNGVRVLVNGSVAADALTSSGAIDGEWHMITITYASDKITLYIDGDYDSDNTDAALDGNFFNGTSKTVIGARYDSGGGGGTEWDYDLNGQVSQFENYDNTLTAAEIKDKLLSDLALFD